ncbi:ABC transporter ATP-binding protein [Proteiniclasticum ruminis]|uniref:ATP-binding cassette, subfamily B n=1 Tax=Proteiniclasticum ruminis TaxID=398199 RepID=A0A1I5ALX5_9CLOT|nr:ATP-binding cassette, subfamily B [Proteiniclasticum ruminis]
MQDEKRNTQMKAPRGPGGPGMGHGMPMGDKPKDFKKTFRKLKDFLKPYFLPLILVVWFAIGSTIFGITGPKILGNVTTKIFEGLLSKITGGPGIDFEGIQRTLLLLLGVYVISSILGFIQSYIVAGVAQKVSYNLRKSIEEKINRLPLSYFDKNSHGDVLSRMTNDVDTVSQSLNQSLSQIITSVTTILGILVMMISISVPMTLIALLILPISMGLMVTIIKRSQRFFKQQQELLGKANGYVEEAFGGHIILKAFNREEKAVSEFTEINEDLKDSAWKSQFFSGLTQPVMMFVGNLGYVFVSILGGYLAILKAISVGDILAFIQYIRRFTQPIAQVAQISNVLQSTVAASERIFAFLEEEEITEDGTLSLRQEDVKGEVTFRNVQFGYKENELIIKNFSLHVEPGQRVAIVGPTGAGKTTLVKLLMRYYELNSGSIEVDGTDIKNLKRRDLRDSIGMVLQDTWLFSGTIMENLRYGKLDASDEEVVRASKASYVHHFVKTLPNGYDMEINEEATNISQGQKQLLTIARVFLKDPAILILDEATSSVDTRTEVLIQESMEKLMKGRTSFIIAHRLSTIRNADVILVMNEGDIVETGTHEELLAKKGFYEKLYNSQFEG